MDFDIHTYKTTQVNRPDMPVPSDTNLSHKILEKLNKYKDLEIEVTEVWQFKITTLSVVIGELGIVAKTARNYVSQIPGAPPLTKLQKITLMDIAHILGKVLSM